MGAAKIVGRLARAPEAPRAGIAGQSSPSLSYCPGRHGQGSRLECPQPEGHPPRRRWCGRMLRLEVDIGGT